MNLLSTDDVPGTIRGTSVGEKNLPPQNISLPCRITLSWKATIAQKTQEETLIFSLTACELEIGTWHLPKPGLSHEPLQLTTVDTPWKSSWGRSGVRCSVLWENWQNRSSERYFKEKIFTSPVLASPCKQKSTKNLHGDICSSWRAATFCKMCADYMYLRLHQNHTSTDRPPASLEQYLRASRNALSWVIVLVLLHIKLNSQLLGGVYLKFYF